MSVYLDAIKVLEQRGWCQGSYYGYRGDGDVTHGPLCVVGALSEVDGGYYVDVERKHRSVLAKALNGAVPNAVLNPDAGCLEQWNDRPSTTYEDVVLALKWAHEATQSEGAISL